MTHTAGQSLWTLHRSFLRRFPLGRALLLLGAPLCATAGCSVDSAPAPEDVGKTSAALLNCPVTDPEYPNCSLPGPPEPPDGCSKATGTLRALSPEVPLGGSTTLSWTVSKPSTCHVDITLNDVSVAAPGSKVVTPPSNTPFRLKLGTRVLASATVTVKLPSTVRINGNSGDWRGLFVQAVGRPNTRVVLATNLDLDLSYFEGIYVSEGVTITSEAPPVAQGGFVPQLGGTTATPPPARNAQNLGPRIFTTTRPLPLFHVASNNVRFIGFRIQGPHQDTEDGDDNLERAIQITSANGVEIGNMEISGFSGQAVYIEDPYDQQVGPGAVSVHDSFIHNNQHKGKDGYGVATNAGSYATIERNVFDFNRHAIKSSGGVGNGYVADRNLVLKGGGVQDTFLNGHIHQFDVHGDENCYDWPAHDDADWNCGNGGDQYVITNNAFQYTNELAIKLRGVPRLQAVIRGNVFAHDSVDDAVQTKSSTRVIMDSNRANIDPFGHYGVCDIDGDGKDDLFLATGVSWWYASAGKMHWTYLSSNTELLDQVGLGDFDGDHRCDVFAVNTSSGAFQISSGAKGPWTDLPGGNQGVPMSELRFGDFNGDKIMDVFRRAPNTEWYAISPGHYPWTLLGSSAAPLSDLRFGDFDGDGITDVFHESGKTWDVSWGGRSPWESIHDSSEHVAQSMIANVDGLPGDDILRYTPTDLFTGHWDVSSGGRGLMRTFATIHSAGSALDAPAASMRTILGNFDGLGGADLLGLEVTRKSQIFSRGSAGFVPHSLYAY